MCPLLLLLVQGLLNLFPAKLPAQSGQDLLNPRHSMSMRLPYLPTFGMVLGNTWSVWEWFSRLRASAAPMSYGLPSVTPRFREGAPEPIHVSVARPRGGDASGQRLGINAMHLVVLDGIKDRRPMDHIEPWLAVPRVQGMLFLMAQFFQEVFFSCRLKGALSLCQCCSVSLAASNW